MSEYRLVMKGVVKTFPGVKALDHAQLELRPVTFSLSVPIFVAGHNFPPPHY